MGVQPWNCMSKCEVGGSGGLSANMFTHGFICTTEDAIKIKPFLMPCGC